MKKSVSRHSPHSIKNIYIKEFLSIVKGLETIPEQEAKLKYLTDYLVLIDEANCEPILILFAYSIERLLRENKFKSYIPELKPMEESNESFKINMIQLRFAADMSADYEAQLFLSTLDGDLYDYVRAYFNQHNIFGIRVPRLIELYDSFKLHRFIKTKLDITMFNYDKLIYQPKHRKLLLIPEIKYPALVFNNLESDIFFYYKYEKQVKTNVEILFQNELDLIFNSYDNLGLLFFIRDTHILPIIVTSRQVAVKTLYEEKTLQQSYASLSDAFSACRRSIKAGDFKLVSNIVFPINTECNTAVEVAQAITSNKFAILFRNRLLLEDSKVREWIVVGVDLNNRTLRLDDGKGDFKVIGFDTLEINESKGVPKIGAGVREIHLEGFYFCALMKK